MKINKKDLSRYTWFEDIDGNIIDVDESVIAPKDENIETYHARFPLEINEKIYKYDPHTGECEKMITFTTSIGRGNEDVILAMANSGDYTLSEAIILYATSCERCANALIYKYLNGADGYEEYSEEWKKCNTSCKYCEDGE